MTKYIDLSRLAHEYANYIIKELRVLNIDIRYQRNTSLSNKAAFLEIIMENTRINIGCWFTPIDNKRPPGIYAGGDFYLPLCDGDIVQKLYEYCINKNHKQENCI